LKGTNAKSSSILKGEITFIKQLQQWLGDKCKWNLCYRASRDGWAGQDFHRHCDNKGPTVVLIKVNNYIFGGYNDQNWAGKLCYILTVLILFIFAQIPNEVFLQWKLLAQFLSRRTGNQINVGMMSYIIYST
jgi:hypothetical protein